VGVVKIVRQTDQVVMLAQIRVVVAVEGLIIMIIIKVEMEEAEL
jgi:hypothetical protein